MNLPKKAIKEFQKLWFKHTGKRISEDKAREEGNKLIELLRIIYQPIPKDYLNKKI